LAADFFNKIDPLQTFADLQILLTMAGSSHDFRICQDICSRSISALVIC
jgi:hypothetical protein